MIPLLVDIDPPLARYLLAREQQSRGWGQSTTESEKLVLDGN